jgi:hypothetical protein
MNRLLIYMAIASAVMFVASLIAIPLILVRLPANYFDRDVPRKRTDHLIVRVAKNILGGVFVVAGVAMLILPGQGLLTILIGISLLDFPGKRRLQTRIVSQPTVLSAINAIRRRFDKPPLAL